MPSKIFDVYFKKDSSACGVFATEKDTICKTKSFAEHTYIEAGCDIYDWIEKCVPDRYECRHAKVIITFKDLKQLDGRPSKND